jgi:hypothetical protein
MGLREEKQRILPALDKATEEAQRQGFITELDLAGIAALFTIAGVLDSGLLKPMEEIKYLSQLQSGLDKYGLSLFGRKEKPELEVGEDTLDELRKLATDSTDLGKLNPENSDHTNSSPN